MAERNNRRKYQLVGNIAGHCLYRNGLAVTTVERVFDMILEAHIKLNHARSNSKNKECIKDQLGYYGVAKTAVQCFVDTCAVVSFVTSWCGTFIYLYIYYYYYFVTMFYICVQVCCKHSTDKESAAATEHDSAKKSR